VRLVFYEKTTHKTRMKRITQMLFDIAVELRRSDLTRVIIWKVVNSLGDYIQFEEILGGSIYYKSHK